MNAGSVSRGACAQYKEKTVTASARALLGMVNAAWWVIGKHRTTVLETPHEYRHSRRLVHIVNDCHLKATACPRANPGLQG
jgi:hypothetical protein